MEAAHQSWEILAVSASPKGSGVEISVQASKCKHKDSVCIPDGLECGHA